MSEKGKNNKKKTGLGLAIWILLFLIILIVFLVKQEEIKENFDKSGATALIEKKIGKDIFDDKKADSKDSGSKDTVIELNLKKNEQAKKSEQKKIEEAQKTEKTSEKPLQSEKSIQTAASDEKKTEVNQKPAEKSVSAGKTQEKNEEKTEEQKTVQATKAPVQAAETAKTEKPLPQVAPAANTTKSKLCFVAIDSDGLVIRKEVTRTVSKDSPLLETIQSLLKGPSSTEASTGCKSYIPSESQILSASVKNGVAYLNFNEEFQFNPNGPDAANIQLMQIVYTATSFSTVKSVQFLIEGKNQQYLTEGVWIGSPLGRNRF